MSFDAASLCLGCMEPKRGGACPTPETCGWTPKGEPTHLSRITPGVVLEHRYLLGRLLGQGGFGLTYLAADIQAFKKLAVKEYFPSSYAARSRDRQTVTHLGPDNREPYQYGLKKFQEEARVLQNFQSHPNIVSVIHSFNANGTGYIVMEFLDGVTLLGHLSAHPGGKIPYDEAMRVARPIFVALEEVHRAKIIHRDVSPDNVYLCRSGNVKLLDFGAARMAFRDQTRSQQLILKRGFTPLEQYHSSGVPGPYTDVYSLAATIYRSITGIAPPDAPERLGEDALVPPSRLCEIPPYAEKALLRALAVNHRDRFQTIEEFRSAILPPDEPRRRQTAPVFPKLAGKPRFTVLWAAATVLLCLGSLLRPAGYFLLFSLGLAPVVMAFVMIDGARRSPQAKAFRLWVAFAVVAFAGIIATAIDARAAILLAASYLIGLAILAAPPPKQRPPEAYFALRFVTGEFAGDSLRLGTAPIVIGRSPEAANVVIPIPEVSAAHAKVWADDRSAGVWIEDLNSRNGTFVFKTSSRAERWSPLRGKTLLSPGDRFYISGEEMACFEIQRPS